MNAPTLTDTPARNFDPGMGLAVAERTILRKKEDGSYEDWGDVANRVALGNSSLAEDNSGAEYTQLRHHLRQASTIMSGRHLQNGDMAQSEGQLERFSNCSTACMSWLSFYLLLNGSGVGRSYDDDLLVTDWGKMPKVTMMIDESHADVKSGEIKAGGNIYPGHAADIELVVLDCEENFDTEFFSVPDSREGWVKVIEKLETMAHEGQSHKELLLDFSGVRSNGTPIAGIQGRPASGPGPLMIAIEKIADLRGTSMPLWEQTMLVDHYLAACVVVGGVRRSARIATKHWLDKDIIDFCRVKNGKHSHEFMWSTNNSVMVDADFWAAVKTGEPTATKILEEVIDRQYKDGTGEPGLVNQDKLNSDDAGLEQMLADGADILTVEGLQPSRESQDIVRVVAKRATSGNRSRMIVNPCGEITLAVYGGYCTIGDVVPYHASSDADALEAFRATTRALIRTNTMPALYGAEVNRTNRIGVGITGVHEYAWSRFGYTWHDLIDESKSQDFWNMMKRFHDACISEALSYSAKLGVEMPHTVITAKPSGSVSKLFALSEGVHLPARAQYIRWVQFNDSDPLIKTYQDAGYPTKRLTKEYKGNTIIGFPTEPEICRIMPSDEVVTANDATPAEQYQWLRLLEKYWLGGDIDGDSEFSNQISYTLKYDPKEISREDYKELLVANQPHIKCCSVMPHVQDSDAYEYLPEENVSKEEYIRIKTSIANHLREDVSFEHISCEGGACPIDFKEGAAA